ncbi:Rv2578c family radical SAM protein [Agreia pratensis]|uniref:DNA repair photolyase n=1 Tax=Agreia pratensis TaxID=150121 RepID=A0A1X7IGG5_9MICO|nr:Rv2578c family radical SAM protein [Agreia pratensis]MBF4633216.1 Rv2578c family radical SAM protein [Agreia pratensis]SMG13830.1 DNA repair photolyase [Agreia pratensis]
MRWSGQALATTEPSALPGLAKLNNLVRSVQTPEFAGVTFHEILAKSALNKIPGQSTSLPYGWTINPYRGCSHACVYCFARPTHTYLDLDAGADFDAQLIVKLNVAEVLQKELRRPAWQHSPVALGTNTDPYQRAEGRYRLMPGIIEALAQSQTPFSILTKGTLLRRDLPLLVEAGATVPVDLAMSIAIYDDDLQQSIEPGTPSTRARLATVTAVREAGLDCSVFLMPILPYLTDTKAHLDDALGQIKAAGATTVLYTALHLRPGVKTWFFRWLQSAHPELVEQYGRMYYGANSYAPKDYRKWLAARIQPLIRAHGLQRAIEDPASGGIRSSAIGRGDRRSVRGPAPSAGSIIPEEIDQGQPTLF